MRADVVLECRCAWGADAPVRAHTLVGALQKLPGVWLAEGQGEDLAEGMDELTVRLVIRDRTRSGAVKILRRIERTLAAGADEWALPTRDRLVREMDEDPEWAKRVRERYLDGEGRRRIARAEGVSFSRVERATAGLVRRPERSRRRTLGEEEVVEIRRRRRGGESCLQLGREYGMSDVAIRKLVRGESYAEAPGALERAEDEAITARQRARGYR